MKNTKNPDNSPFKTTEELKQFVDSIKGLNKPFLKLTPETKAKLIALNLKVKTLKKLRTEFQREAGYGGPSGSDPNVVNQFLLALQLADQLGHDLNADVKAFKVTYNQLRRMKERPEALIAYLEARKKSKK